MFGERPGECVSTARGGGRCGASGRWVTRFVDCRFRGQGYEVTVPAPRDDATTLATAFRAAHRARHGHGDSDQPIELVNLRVVAERPVGAAPVGRRAGIGVPSAGRRMIVTRDGKRVRADVWPLGEMPAGRLLNAPRFWPAPMRRVSSSRGGAAPCMHRAL